MINTFSNFLNILDEYNAKFRNPKLSKVVNNYTFVYIQEIFDITKNQIIYQNFKESKISIIDQCISNNEQEDDKFFIICFKKTLILIKQSSIQFLQPLFSSNSNLTIYYLSNIKDTFNQSIKICNVQLNARLDISFLEEIYSFNQHLKFLKMNNKLVNQIWKVAQSCISGFLIKEGFEKLNKDRLEIFTHKLTNENNTKSSESWNEDDYIELLNIGNSFSSFVILVFHIEKEELYVIKKTAIDEIETPKLMKREQYNYSFLNHPLLPKFYGTVKEKKYAIIEFINGETLLNIEQMHLDINDKITIIFELILIIQYLHISKFIYRDLKPNNVIIDKNKNAVLIDFDRMLSIYDNDDHTRDFPHCFAAPEMQMGKVSYRSDVYSLGQMIYFIMNEKEPLNEMNHISEEKIEQIYKKCTNKSIENRPSIYELFNEFYSCYKDKINPSLIENNPQIHFILGVIHSIDDFGSPDVNKAIHHFSLAANQNYLYAQINLGIIYGSKCFHNNDIDKAIKYYESAANKGNIFALNALGSIYSRENTDHFDINKSIHYYSLAAKMNDYKALNNLGYIYLKEKYGVLDINKAIHYFTLASEQNSTFAQNNLGSIYLNGDLVTRDIKKSIYFFTLAADQNDSKAQYNLGLIYLTNRYGIQNIDKAIHYFKLAADSKYILALKKLGFIYYTNEYISRDIEKSIQYFSFAADFKDAESQYILGYIYSSGEFISVDIKKAIHFYTLAADQNYVDALTNLGNIYCSGDYISCDVDKAIQYYTIAANLNDVNAQYNLGFIYSVWNYYPKDIKKAIHYYTLAAKQNNADALFYLGFVYSKGDHVEQDINKAIHYYTLAAKQNHEKAQNNLGIIFLKGELVPRDINKAIHYFNLAAKQNFACAQHNLGFIYHTGDYVTRDINKAIHYYSLAAEQNHADSQNNLGAIYLRTKTFINSDIPISYFSSNNTQQKFGFTYHSGDDIKQDVEKAIHYFKLAADQNHPDALNSLGNIYYSGEFIPQNINKAIYYYTLSSNQHCSLAQYMLGYIYFSGKYVQQNMNKAINYFTISANQNNANSHYMLGIFYLDGYFVQKYVKKGIYHLTISSQNKNMKASFLLGFLYHEGKEVKRDIKKSIHFYKVASSFDCNFSKNNLGIIYRHGFGDEIKPNIQLSIEYFTEAIGKKNDSLSMFNLAHIYIYENSIKGNIDESIELLIKSSLLKFTPSKYLLCLVLVKKFGYDLNTIRERINQSRFTSNDFSNEICDLIKHLRLDLKGVSKNLYNYFEKIDFLYKFPETFVQASKINDENSRLNPNAKDINAAFYEGFAI